MVLHFTKTNTSVFIQKNICIHFLMGYLNILSVLRQKAFDCRVTDKLERIWKETSVALLRCYPSTFLEENY